MLFWEFFSFLIGSQWLVFPDLKSQTRPFQGLVFRFSCSLKKVALFPCYLKTIFFLFYVSRFQILRFDIFLSFKPFVPLFPWNKCSSSTVPLNSWEVSRTILYQKARQMIQMKWRIPGVPVCNLPIIVVQYHIMNMLYLYIKKESACIYSAPTVG